MRRIGQPSVGFSLGQAVLAVFLLLETGSVAFAKPAYVGTWATNGARCKLPPDTLDAPVVMTYRAYNQFETHCDFRSLKRVRGAWRAPVRCLVEGNRQKDVLTIWAGARAMSLQWNTAKPRFDYVRCK